VTKPLISSAPARRETKLAIMGSADPDAIEYSERRLRA
jgi:hypothetical protein